MSNKIFKNNSNWKKTIDSDKNMYYDFFQERRLKMYNIKLTFKLDKAQLPRETEKLILSFIKKTVEKADTDFFAELFQANSSVMKSYCFSSYLPGAEFKKDKIILSDTYFNILFSDYNFNKLIFFYNAFLDMKHEKYPIKDNFMYLTYVSMQKLNEISDNTLVIKMLSPLMVRKHDMNTNKDRYLVYSDEDFSDTLKANLIWQIKNSDLVIDASDFSIEPVKCRKVVVSTFGKLQNASIGVFKIHGNPKLLNFLYMSGLGSRRSEGRGKWEVIS